MPTTKTVGVLIVHGMGSQDDTYAEKLVAELKDRLGTHHRRVAWHAVHWADVLIDAQAAYLERADAYELDWARTRRFVVTALSDAASYRWLGVDNLDDPRTTYGRIHRHIRQGLRVLREQVGNEGKLVILAHSLGGHVVSNYIWDVQHPAPPKTTPPIPEDRFTGAGTLRLLVTFGCNIPLFTFALDEAVPINLPDDAHWHNFFDRDDPLGYPLTPINNAYAAICTDREISVGNPLTFSSFTPLSHTRYWTDNDFTKPVATLIHDVIGS